MPRLQPSTLVLLLAASCCTTSSSEPQVGHAPSNEPRPEPERSSEPPPVPGRWVAMATVDAPPGREDHSAVWTGTEMIVWGGELRDEVVTALGDGARYSPSEDVWRPMSMEGGPEQRDDHAVVWTGSEMIIWGGNQVDEDTQLLASGARYNPATNTWTALPLGPLSPRDDATAVWTGSEMIVWGGRTFAHVHENTGARYDPALDRWQPTSTQSAPHAREDHSAVWTGSEMLIWGGWSGDDKRRDHSSDGARYDPLEDRWRAIASSGAPSPREDHSAVWTGTEMIIWGGVVHQYVDVPAPEAKREPVDQVLAPVDEVLVDEASVEAASVEAAPVEAALLEAALLEAALLEAALLEALVEEPSKPSRQLVQLASGARYDPKIDAWQPMSSVGAPAAREDHIAIWTGNELVIWGGRNDKSKLGDGAIYDPKADRWRPLVSEGPVPSPRWNPSAVWAGNQVIIWGGRGDDYPGAGGRYMW